MIFGRFGSVAAEAEFWDVIGTKFLRNFLLSVTSNNGFTPQHPPPPLEQKWFKLVCMKCKHCILKSQV
jgi:hypothetical protein